MLEIELLLLRDEANHATSDGLAGLGSQYVVRTECL